MVTFINGTVAKTTTVAMELARILAKRQPKSTIILAAVAGEEQGLYGGR